MSYKKFFTEAEANALVPELLEIIPCLQDLMGRMQSDFPDIAQARKQAKFNGGSVQGPDYLRLLGQYNKLTGYLTSRGCVLKGIDQGLVDFPAVREGKTVFLCWKNPESKVTHWHDLDSGFAGRRKLE